MANWEFFLQTIGENQPLDKATTALEAAPKGELATTQEESLENLRSRLVNDADEILEELVSDIFSSVEAKLPPATNPETSPYSLHLEEDVLSVSLNKPILISGEVTSEHASASRELRLEIILRDPKTGTVVAQLSPRVFASSFPFPFCCSLTLSQPCNTYLLQGEITLIDATEKTSSGILAYQTFTVTANWKQLEPLVATAITSPQIFHPPAPLSPSSDQDSTRWQGILPPKLTSRKRKMSPQLPNLPNTVVREKKRKPKQEDVCLEENDTVAEYSQTLQWELIPELVITSEEKKT